MSGVQNRHTDWKDQLSEAKLQINVPIGETATGGFVSNRRRRQSSSSDKNAERIDPFGEVFVAKASRRDRSGRSKGEYGRGAELLFTANPIDISGSATHQGIGEEEARMSKKNLDQQTDDELDHQDTRDGSDDSVESAEGEEAVIQPTPEQIAEQQSIAKTNARVRKGVKIGALGFGSLILALATVAVGAGLMGKHKSNIMNM